MSPWGRKVTTSCPGRPWPETLALLRHVRNQRNEKLQTRDLDIISGWHEQSDLCWEEYLFCEQHVVRKLFTIPGKLILSTGHSMIVPLEFINWFPDSVPAKHMLEIIFSTFSFLLAQLCCQCFNLILLTTSLRLGHFFAFGVSPPWLDFFLFTPLHGLGL